jgi:predicted transcriptional regulator
MPEEIENVDYVVCQICGKHFLELNASHIKRKHHISYNKYLETYPDAKLRCDNSTNNYKKYNKNKQIEGKIKDIDYIECPICGKILKRLDTHLIDKHNMHLDEFKKMYPNIKNVCEKSKEKRSLAVSKSRHKLYSNPETSEKFKNISRKGAKNLWNNLSDNDKIEKMENMRQKWKVKYNKLSTKDRAKLLNKKYSYKKIEKMINNKKYIFRSKFELNTAIILADLGIEFEHESFTVPIKNGHYHLIDFYIKQFNLIIECKSSYNRRKNLYQILDDVITKKKCSENIGYNYEMNWFSKNIKIIKKHIIYIINKYKKL